MTRKPRRIKKKFSLEGQHSFVSGCLSEYALNTVCRSARCPNRFECFAEGTATFMILGDICTRACRFCAVKSGAPGKPDSSEPGRIASAVRKLGLSYCVVTSVTRDDLPDKGVDHFINTVRAVRKECPGVPVEVLVPDFSGDLSLASAVAKSGIKVFNHNIETVPSKYAGVRPGASYQRSLSVLKAASVAVPGLIVKSGMMLGLGENEEEVFDVMDDLLDSGCSALTIGQYLSPERSSVPVERYLEDGEFEYFRSAALEKGFAEVFSGTFIRSSYMAEKMAYTAENFQSAEKE